MKIAAALVTVCFLIAFSLSVTGWFERFSAAQLFGMGAFLSTGGFVTLHWLSQRFRLFLRSRSLKRLTLAQTLRFYGILALVKTHQHVLPAAAFAVPTGLSSTLLLQSRLFLRRRLRMVTAAGQNDRGFCRVARSWARVSLAVSVVMAVLTSSPRFGLVEASHTSQPMTWFPMSLVPVFIGPMVLIFHSARSRLRSRTKKRAFVTIIPVSPSAGQRMRLMQHKRLPVFVDATVRNAQTHGKRLHEH